MSKVLVTGGTGFIGSNLVQRLLALGHDVIATGHQTEQQLNGCKMLEPSLIGINWDEIKDIDALFHIGANNNTLSTDETEMFRANVESSKVLFNKCLEVGCKNFVFASSTAIYGNEPAPYVEDETPINPLNCYGESKSALERFAFYFSAAHKVKVVGLRYCNVYGPGESHKGKRASMVYQIMKQLLDGKHVKLFKYGEQRRDFIHVDDVVEANLRAWEYDKSDIFNCGLGKATSFIDLHNYIANECYLNSPEIDWIDNPNTATYQQLTECSMKKAKELLGFEPKISIYEGIKKYLIYLRNTAA